MLEELLETTKQNIESEIETFRLADKSSNCIKTFRLSSEDTNFLVRL